MGIVAEEADESVLWLELLEETGILSHERLQDILKEAKELVAIFSTSLKESQGQQVGVRLLIHRFPYLPNRTDTCPPGGILEPAAGD
jgi:hypothetical protein